jgi:2-amino-4-hydroxy-6-hydroxymethyldihydropteridine diphosphokinase
MTPTRRATVALGSNFGDRAAALRLAVGCLADTPGVRVVAVSPVYETDPVGGPVQSDFLNAVVLVDTELTAEQLLVRALGIEAAAGRVRGPRWGPRVLDVDLIAVGTERRRHPDPVLPHPRAHERAFVLVPWQDVDPQAVLPGRGRIADLLAAVDRSGVRRTDVVLHRGRACR